MHAGHFRFQAVNNTGASATVTLKYRGKKFDSNGALSYGTETTIMNAVAIGAGSQDNSTVIDNTTDLNLEGELSVSVTSSGTPDGDVTVLLQRSNDGTNFPSDGAGGLVTSINFAAVTTSNRVENVS